MGTYRQMVRSVLPARVFTTGYSHEHDCAVHTGGDCDCTERTR